MKTIKKVICFLLCAYLAIGLIWAAKIAIIHYLNVDGLPVLGYHDIVSDEDKEKNYKHDIYHMSISEFEKQMQYLYENNYHTLTMQEIEAYYNGSYQPPKKAVALTFDDGYKSFNTIVKKVLQKYNFQATCFVIGYKTTIDNPKYLKKEDLINDENVQYYSHSYNFHHCQKALKMIETLSKEQINNDFNQNKNIVSSKYFAFPYGVASEESFSVLKQQNVSLAFGYNQNRNMTRKDNQYLLPRYSMFANMPFIYFKWICQ